MKPVPFDYHVPGELGEALEMLAQLDNARPLAGGQSLVPMLNLRVATPDHVIDLNRIEELRGVRIGQDRLRIGAMTTQRTLERSDVIASFCPMLVQALEHIGHQQTRNRGTIGGSICHMDPGAELPVVASALDATLCVASRRGRRFIGMKDFPAGYLTTQLEADELLVSIEMPKDTRRCGTAFVEFSRRPADFAIVSVAALVEIAPVGTIERVAISIGGLDAVPTRLLEFEETVLNHPMNDEVVRGAMDAARQTPAVDQGEYTAEYRSHVAALLCERSFRHAWQRAVQGG